MPKPSKRAHRYLSHRSPVAALTSPHANDNRKIEFQLTPEAIASVLNEYSERLVDTRGRRIRDLAPRIMAHIDHQVIASELARLPAQSMAREYALQRAVKAELVRVGYLEF